MKYNMNTTVEVTLTEYGKRIFEEHYAEFLKEYPEFRNDMDKYIVDSKLKLPLWQVSHIFGNTFYHGNPDVPFEANEIDIIGN